MATFGEMLRSAREDRGLSIEDVSRILEVDQQRLQALERNDFATLPGETIMIDCLRAYADCLEVEADLMIEDYVRERDKCLQQLADAIPDRNSESESAAARTERNLKPGDLVCFVALGSGLSWGAALYRC